jgi:PAS domain S-box-containing protein
MGDPSGRPPGTAAPPGAAGDGDVFGHAFDQDALALAEQSAGIGVWSIDLLSGRVRATAQFFRIMGLEPTDEPIPVERVRALRHPDDRERVLAGFREVLEGGIDAYEMEYRIIRPDGQLRWIFGRGRVVRDAAGRPVRYSGVDLDITDRKAAEAALAAAKEQLERMNVLLEQRVRERTAELEAEARRRIEAEGRLHQAQKMEAVGQLTGGIAHDFNNLLQVILGQLQIASLVLKRGKAALPGMNPREVLRTAIATSQRSALSAAQLVQRLLAFSRLQTLEPTPLDANALVDGMVDMITRILGETITVELALAPDLWLTYADANQLESALLNLVVNARDAMPHGGRLRIETANVRGGGEGPDAGPAGEHVTIAVSDTGCGIPPELLDKVFEPFFTTKDTGKGTGLGLSTVYGFVKQSGGHVRLSSELGAGSTVRIYLPRLVAGHGQAFPRRAPEEPAEVLPRARRGETILMVEDHDDVRQFGAAALESLGYRVVQAVDGASALRLLDEPGGTPPHLLLTDVVLPGGMSGLALAGAVAERRPGLPVLFTTGHTRHLAPGGVPPDASVLGKPYTLERLAASVREAIEGRGAEGARGPRGRRPARPASNPT